MAFLVAIICWLWVRIVGVIQKSNGCSFFRHGVYCTFICSWELHSLQGSLCQCRVCLCVTLYVCILLRVTQGAGQFMSMLCVCLCVTLVCVYLLFSWELHRVRGSLCQCCLYLCVTLYVCI